MEGSSEAWWGCLFVGEFKRCTVGIASCGLWVVSLHKFGESLGEVGCWGVFCVLGVKLFVPCWGLERGRGRFSRWEMYSNSVGALLIPASEGVLM